MVREDREIRTVDRSYRSNLKRSFRSLEEMLERYFEREKNGKIKLHEEEKQEIRHILNTHIRSIFIKFHERSSDIYKQEDRKNERT